MMWFFEWPDNRALLLAELASWKGTRFMAHQGRKQIGADCVRFGEAVLVNVGAIDPIDWPEYVVTGGGPDMLDIFYQTLDAIPKLARVWKIGGGARPMPLPGDLLLCSSVRGLHHLCVSAEVPLLYHCLMQNGVGEGNLFDPIIDRHIRAIYRARLP